MFSGVLNSRNVLSYVLWHYITAVVPYLSCEPWFANYLCYSPVYATNCRQSCCFLANDDYVERRTTSVYCFKMYPNYWRLFTLIKKYLLLSQTEAMCIKISQIQSIQLLPAAQRTAIVHLFISLSIGCAKFIRRL